MNVITRRRSIEPHKMLVEHGTYDRLRFIAHTLAQRRMVEHSISDALLVAFRYVSQSVPKQVKILAKFYVRTEQEMVHVYMTKDLKKQIFQYASQNKITALALLDAVVTIFTKSLLSTIWREKGYDYDTLKNEVDFLIQSDKKAYQSPPKISPDKIPLLTKKKQADANIMRHHNYIVEFREYMDKFGGIDSWINKNLYLMIHSKPLKGSIGKESDIDEPKESNPGRVHTVRIWKRGRGYNITVLGNSVDSSYGYGAPSLEAGSVFRLYDIYRNIDWLTIKAV